MKKALEGIVVLDFSRYISGPNCAMLLADLGAYVIKVEKAGIGEEMRVAHPYVGDQSLGFPPFNRNKKSLGLYIRHPEALAILRELIPRVDIVVQNFRPGTIDKMGMGFDYCQSVNPRLIMASISGFGQSGPYRERIAFDGVIQAESGLTDSIRQESGGIPCLPTGNPCDMFTSLQSAIAILAALEQREKTERGQHLDIGMFDCNSGMYGAELCAYGLTGENPWQHPAVPYGLFPCSDGWVFLEVNDAAWPAFAVTMGQDQWPASYPTLAARLAAEEEIRQLVSAWTEGQSSKALRRLLEPLGVAVGKMNTIDQVGENEHLRAQGQLVEMPVFGVGQVTYPALPFRMSGCPVDYAQAPTIGEHNLEILSRFLNFSAERVTELLEQGILYESEHPHWF